MMKKNFTTTLLSLFFLLGLTGELSSQLTFSLNPAVSAYEQGDVFCLSVNVEDFENIISTQFSINYDTALLNFTEVQSYGLPGYSDLAWAGFFNTVYPGAVLFSWLSDDMVNGSTVDDGAEIFQLCFEVVGEQGVTAIEFSGDPISVEVVSEGDVFLTPQFNGALVSIGNDLAFGVVEDLTFSLPFVLANEGENVCLDVVVENFTNIVSAQFSMNYDTSLLSYTGSQGSNQGYYNLPNLTGSNIGNPSAGNITFSWLSDDLTDGTTVPDSTSIFQICFDVLGLGGDTAIVDFSAIPVPIEISNSDGELLLPTFVPGAIYIPLDVATSSPDHPVFNYLPLSPNPMLDVSYLRFTLQETADVQWRVRAMDGRLILEGDEHLPKGQHEIPLYRNQFPAAGTYLVELMAGGYYGARTLMFTR